MAAWVTVKVFPAIVNVPVRCTVVELGATVKVAVPLPEPLAPLVTVIHVNPVDAVHVQPAVVVTVEETLPPAAATDCEVGEIEYVHPVGACVTVNV